MALTTPPPPKKKSEEVNHDLYTFDSSKFDFSVLIYSIYIPCSITSKLTTSNSKKND